MNISIVILNWNRKKDTLDCLRSIEKLKIKSFKLQVIVVDNGSSDGSQKSVDKYFKENPRINGIQILNKDNYGYAKGNNVGIRYAIANGADGVLILNNDTQVDDNLLVDLTGQFRKRKRVGALTPKMYFSPGYEFHRERYKKADLGKVIWYAGGTMDWDNVYGENRGVNQVDKGQYDNVRETDFASGACVFLNVEALKEVGIYDEKYFMYLEDVDLSQRLKNNGWKVLYAPPAHIWHKVAQSSGIGSGLNDYYTTRNRLLFGLRYSKFRTKVALVKESLFFLVKSRKWQRKGVIDYYLCRFGKGSFNN